MAVNAATESKIRTLMEAVDRADRAGNRRDADRAMGEARALAPDHPGVLNAAGMRLLSTGDAGAARPLLERAAALDPASPALWQNLAIVQRALEDDVAERDALEKALVADPRYYPALLQKARLLERQGKTKQAAYMYDAFVLCVPPEVRVQPAMQVAIAHATRVMNENVVALEAFLAPRLAEARDRHPGARKDRFEACLEAILGKRPFYVPQPTFMNFPRLPAIEFFDRADFPWLDAFEEATAGIRDEALEAFSAASELFVPYISKPAGAPVDQWMELNNSKRWSTYFLFRNGKGVEGNLARCPRTAALLRQAPLCDVPEHAPTAFFSVLAPGTRIPPHTGVTNTRLIVHVPLVVPPGCGFRVGAEKREWIPGRAFVFDDTFEHEAWNDSGERRIVLIFDIWNPFLTPAERDLVTALTAGINEYYQGESPFKQGG